MVARHAYSDRDQDDPDRKRLDNVQRELSFLHLRLTNYALTRGYSYVCWQQVINCMLWKEPGNIKIHRTRVVHIYEADYNLTLSLKWREALSGRRDWEHYTMVSTDLDRVKGYTIQFSWKFSKPMSRAS